MVISVTDQLARAVVWVSIAAVPPHFPAFALLLNLALALEGQPLKRVATPTGGLHALPAWLIEKWLASENLPPHRHSGCRLSQYTPSLIYAGLLPDRI